MDIRFEVVHALPGRTRIRVTGLRDSQALADKVADVLLSKPGVTCVRVNPVCASVVVNYDVTRLHTFIPEKHLRGLTLEALRGRVSVKAGSNGHGQGILRNVLSRIAGLLVPTAALGLSLARRLVPMGPMYALVAAAAAPIFSRAARTAIRERRLGVDFLDATAVAIMGAQRNLPTCAFMAWLISLGEHIREETARRSRKAIADLLEFNSGGAWVLRRGRRVKVPVGALIPGDAVVVNAGDVIPVDGLVSRGRAAVDQRSLTGESAMQEKRTGDRVYAGTVAIDGELVVRAEAVGNDTRTGRIVAMLRSAPTQETRIEDYAARFADRLVLPTFAASGAVFALTQNLARALSMLIVDFGTGVRVAAPTAFLSFMAYAAQHNIVIKGGRALEKLAAVDTVVFDKTGTLTTGLPEVRSVEPVDGRATVRSVISLAAGAEHGLSHPIANALLAKATELGARVPSKIDARLHVGMGVKASVQGKQVLVGSRRLMTDEGIELTRFASEPTDSSESELFVAVNGRLHGVITYADRVRPESRCVVDGLKALGIGEVIVLTGDREEVARETCRDLGVERWHSSVFPEQKLEIVRGLQRNGRTVAVVGDGVNDSLALAHADVAVAPAGATDAAKEAADVLLMEDDLRLLTQAFIMARSAVDLVRQNYRIVAVPNAAALALAAGGLLGPPGATLINNGTTVAAGLNGLRPLVGRNGRRGNGRKPVCALPGDGYPPHITETPNADGWSGAEGAVTHNSGRQAYVGYRGDR